MDNPLVSIVIPSYKPEFFEQSLKSAIGQTYPNTEIIVSDNCPDESIETICRKYGNINYHRNPDKGAKNVLDTLYAGRGTLIKPLFDDDLLHPFCVERMVRAISSNASIGLVFSASATIDNANNKTSVRKLNITNSLLSGKDLQRHMVLNFKNLIGEFSTVLYRRTDVNRFLPDGLFRYHGKDYSFGLADVAAFFNLSDQKNIFYCEEELSYFRHDSTHQSNSNPAANPNFVNCVTEWVDLMLVALDTGIITPEEFTASRDLVVSFLEQWVVIYPVVERYRQQYLERVESLLNYDKTTPGAL